MPVINLADWRGGYATDVPSELMADNELQTAENVYWEGGLRKRGGISSFLAVTSNALRGALRVFTNGSWTTIYAKESTGVSDVQFYQGASTTLATITRSGATAYSWTVGYDIQFTQLGDKVVAVNGYDRPAIIYVPTAAATLVVADLEQYDVRERASSNWFAGQYTPSSSWVSDTTDAQSATASDFIILEKGTTTNGFYVSCDYTFSKLVFSGCDGLVSAPDVAYQYYNGTTWTAIGTTNQVPTWTSTGDHTLEFEIPMNVDGDVLWQTLATSVSDLNDKYAVRVLFGGHAASATATMYLDYVDVYHTHYLSQIMAGVAPQAVTTHKNHVFMAAENIINFSRINSLKNWSYSDLAYAQEGGKEVIGMITHGDYLAILKESAIYGITGNSWENFTLKMLTESGTVARRGFGVHGNILWYVARDGIYGWDGNKTLKYSKHIQTDFNTMYATNVNYVRYKGYSYFFFPTLGYALMFDPDTIRMDDTGDGRVSFYLQKNHYLSQAWWQDGASDDGYLVGIYNAATPTVMRGDTGTWDIMSAASASITTKWKTKYYGFKGPQIYKCYHRIKPKLADASATAGIAHTFKIYSADEHGEATSSALINVGVGTGFHQEDISVPPDMDGKLIAFYGEHGSMYLDKLYSISVDYESRGY